MFIQNVSALNLPNYSLNHIQCSPLRFRIFKSLAFEFAMPIAVDEVEERSRKVPRIHSAYFQDLIPIYREKLCLSASALNSTSPLDGHAYRCVRKILARLGLRADRQLTSSRNPPRRAALSVLCLFLRQRSTIVSIPSFAQHDPLEPLEPSRCRIICNPSLCYSSSLWTVRREGVDRRDR